MQKYKKKNPLQRELEHAHGWETAFYGFSFWKRVMLFTMIVLVDTGGSILKPLEKEKKVLMIVIPLRVCTNFAAVVIDETVPSLTY